MRRRWDAELAASENRRCTSNQLSKTRRQKFSWTLKWATSTSRHIAEDKKPSWETSSRTTSGLSGEYRQQNAIIWSCAIIFYFCTHTHTLLLLSPTTLLLLLLLLLLLILLLLLLWLLLLILVVSITAQHRADMCLPQSPKTSTHTHDIFVVGPPLPANPKRLFRNPNAEAS